MGLCNSPDIFQEKMSELFVGLDTVRVYIDDLLRINRRIIYGNVQNLIGWWACVYQNIETIVGIVIV